MGTFEVPQFLPASLFKNPHLQTLAAAAIGQTRFVPQVENWFVSVAGERNQVRCDCSWQADPWERTTAVVVHGLGGSSSSPIVVGMASALWAAGMNVVRYNMRNCGGTEDHCRTLYHSGMHGDLVHVLEGLLTRGCKSIVLVGFSAGGNLVMNAVASLGSSAPPQLAAAASISGALDVAAAADNLHRGASRFYEWLFIRGLVKLFERKIELFPDIFHREHLRNFHSIRDFDNDITAPYSGYRDADDIYSAIASSRWLERVAVPTLVVQSQDDPFITLLPGTREKIRANKNITLLEPRNGGHCGFFAQGNRWWAPMAVQAFFAARGVRVLESAGAGQGEPGLCAPTRHQR